LIQFVLAWDEANDLVFNRVPDDADRILASVNSVNRLFEEPAQQNHAFIGHA
jgi:hypothetical protein